MLFNYILYGLTLILLLVSFLKDRRKTLQALKKAWKAFENILPQFLGILLLIGLMLSVLSPETISSVIGSESGWLGILLAALLGSVTLVPGFIAFPLAAALLKNGAALTTIAVFVSTLMMVGVVTLPLEIKYFGKRAALTRNGLAFVCSVAVALVIGGILR
jgi:uncharacterized membrane protein YraQ (UPF0718 family)